MTKTEVERFHKIVKAEKRRSDNLSKKIAKLRADTMVVWAKFKKEKKALARRLKERSRARAKR